MRDNTRQEDRRTPPPIGPQTYTPYSAKDTAQLVIEYKDIIDQLSSPSETGFQQTLRYELYLENEQQMENDEEIIPDILRDLLRQMNEIILSYI